jgi:recombination protein U
MIKVDRMTVAEYRASVQGKMNRAQGLEFERVVDEACEHYKSLELAHIEKTPEPMKVIKVLNRKLGQFVAVFSKAAQPDYKGTMQGGRSVVFDAKSTETDRIQQKVVTEGQWEALDLHETMGAYCFILVALGLSYYRVPWAKWKTMKEDCGHKYMNASDLAPYKLGSYPEPLRFLG